MAYLDNFHFNYSKLRISLYYMQTLHIYFGSKRLITVKNIIRNIMEPDILRKQMLDFIIFSFKENKMK